MGFFALSDPVGREKFKINVGPEEDILTLLRGKRGPLDLFRTRSVGKSLWFHLDPKKDILTLLRGQRGPLDFFEPGQLGKV